MAARTDKDNYYLDIAEATLERGTCLRRNYGAVIVNHDQIVATGYTGSPRGCKNCIDVGACLRQQLGIPRGEKYEMCRSVHAEANAIISASRNEMLGGIIYLVGREADGSYVKDANSCSMCKRLIINAGIKQVVIRDTKEAFRVIHVRDWVYKEEEAILGAY